MDITTNTVKCYGCESELELELGALIGRGEECPSCKRSLRCCMMCGFFDKLVYNECKEPNAERILDKEKKNFCSYFTLGFRKEGLNSSKLDLLDAANALFKK